VGDYSIQGAFDASCSAASIKHWLETPEGLAGWWSDRVEGSAEKVGDEFHVHFPSTPVVFDLRVTINSEDAVEWFIPESPPWWKGTTIRFDLSEDNGRTKLRFSHRGFEPSDPIIEVITPAWVRFLDNLVAVAESGHPNPAVVN
jgi:hypothetical protein